MDVTPPVLQEVHHVHRLSPVLSRRLSLVLSRRLSLVRILQVVFLQVVHQVSQVVYHRIHQVLAIMDVAFLVLSLVLVLFKL